MNFTRLELKTICRAITLATLNEQEFIRCHSDRSGKSIDQKITKQTETFIAQMQAIRERIWQEGLASGAEKS